MEVYLLASGARTAETHKPVKKERLKPHKTPSYTVSYKHNSYVQLTRATHPTTILGAVETNTGAVTFATYCCREWSSRDGTGRYITQRTLHSAILLTSMLIPRFIHN
jgi:hypothetical protein